MGLRGLSIDELPKKRRGKATKIIAAVERDPLGYLKFRGKRLLSIDRNEISVPICWGYRLMFRERPGGCRFQAALTHEAYNAIMKGGSARDSLEGLSCKGEKIVMPPAPQIEAANDAQRHDGDDEVAAAPILPSFADLLESQAMRLDQESTTDQAEQSSTDTDAPARSALSILVEYLKEKERGVNFEFSIYDILSELPTLKRDKKAEASASAAINYLVGRQFLFETQKRRAKNNGRGTVKVFRVVPKLLTFEPIAKKPRSPGAALARRDAQATGIPPSQSTEWLTPRQIIVSWLKGKPASFEFIVPEMLDARPALRKMADEGNKVHSAVFQMNAGGLLEDTGRSRSHTKGVRLYKIYHATKLLHETKVKWQEVIEPVLAAPAEAVAAPLNADAGAAVLALVSMLTNDIKELREKLNAPRAALDLASLTDDQLMLELHSRLIRRNEAQQVRAYLARTADLKRA